MEARRQADNKSSSENGLSSPPKTMHQPPIIKPDTRRTRIKPVMQAGMHAGTQADKHQTGKQQVVTQAGRHAGSMEAGGEAGRQAGR